MPRTCIASMLPPPLEDPARSCDAAQVRSRTASVSCATALCALLGLAAWATAGNGESGKPIPRILADIRAAAGTARSLHIVASGTSGGSALSFDLRIGASGGEGTISENGLSFQIVRLGDRLYFDASPAFWRHYGGAVAAELFKGRWIWVTTSSGQFASFTSFTELPALVDGILSSHGRLAKGAAATVAGRAAFSLVDTTQGGTLWVAADGPPYPLELTPGKGNSGSIRFEDWNAPLRVVAPADAISYAALTKRG